MILQKKVARFFYKIYKVLNPDSPIRKYIPKRNDVLLVSYPRSGNTWMRVMLAELLYGESGDGLRDLQYYIPDVYLKFERDKLIETDFHIVKSHHPFHVTNSDESIRNRIIYLIRDPRDVVLSHFRYQKYNREYRYDFEKFLSDWLCGRIWPCSWQEHVNSWMNERDHLEIVVCLIRYEDLLSNSREELERVSNFLGIIRTSDEIERAISMASIDRMRQKESISTPKHDTANGFQFIGSGCNNQWKGKLTCQQKEWIETITESLMSRFGYI